MVGAAEAARLAADLVGPDAVVTREGAGWDHEAWRVVGRDGRPWIVRWGIEGDADELAAEVRREVAVMHAARAVLGDLVADAVVVDEARGCLAYPRVPGTPLQDLLVAGSGAGAGGRPPGPGDRRDHRRHRGRAGAPAEVERRRRPAGVVRRRCPTSSP